MRLSQARIDGIIRRHLPRGWKHEQRKTVYLHGENVRGYVEFIERKIITETVKDRETLFCFLHEVGHVRCKHVGIGIPRYIEEYEAEWYAITAMRNEEIPVPQEELFFAKQNVRDQVRAAEENDEDVHQHIKRWSSRK